MTVRSRSGIGLGKLEEVSRQASETGPAVSFLPGRSSQGIHHMTLSASEDAADSDRLGRTLELYRDLSVALRGRIDQLKAGTAGKDEGKDAEDALKSYQKILQTVLDLEASLVRRREAGAAGAGAGLDLDAARAEILARLAVWAAAR